MIRVVVPEIAWADRRERILEFPDGWDVRLYPMRGFEAGKLGREELLKALRNPIGSKPLRRLAEGREEVVIVFDDHTRPTRVEPIARAVLEELKVSGVRDDRIRFIAATGAHGAMDRIGFVKKLGEEIVECYPVYNHSPFHGCERIGETRRGTPIEVNGEFLSCDLKIAIGCIVPHPMFGFGGGAKIVLPGVASINAISHNHAVVGGYVKGAKPHESTGWGKARGNILMEDAIEFAEASGLDFKIDALINGFNETTAVFCGKVPEEHRAGLEKAKEAYSSEKPSGYDVIVLNVSSKSNEALLALSAWHPFIEENSIVVLIANDPRGQITHYAYGKFGKKSCGTIFNPPRRLRNIEKLIVYSEYPEVDPQLPITYPEDIEWIKDWGEVLEEIMSIKGRRGVRVAVIPNADIQCAEEILLP